MCTSVWSKITPNEMVCFHKALPNVKSVYVALQVTPDLQKNYTDISAISVTLYNSDSFTRTILSSLGEPSNDLISLSFALMNNRVEEQKR